MAELYDFKVDEIMDVFVLIKSADKRTAKNGKKFIAFVFEDQSGELPGMYWDASDEDVVLFQPGKVVRLNAKRENYQGKPQVKIIGLRLAKETEPHDADYFMPHAPEKRSEIEDEINQFIFDITQPTWARIVRNLLQKHHDEFFVYPAAKTNHHAFAGGLSFHTLSMLRLGKAVVNQYECINAALLYAGTILHDIGKTVELSGAVSTSYTTAGNLVGHISIADGEIVAACQTLKINPEQEDVLLLRHMILSHHGLLEYGSPVRPRLLEAEILHRLDEMDASIMMIETALKHTPNGDFSERIFGMDQRSFYKPNDRSDKKD
ncbi:HD domain-containing protein [Paucilactobacillus suebicus]|nr:HD domain-containing protein [Paucilactobacillus suebicus]